MPQNGQSGTKGRGKGKAPKKRPEPDSEVGIDLNIPVFIYHLESSRMSYGAGTAIVAPCGSRADIASSPPGVRRIVRTSYVDRATPLR